MNEQLHSNSAIPTCRCPLAFSCTMNEWLVQHQHVDWPPEDPPWHRPGWAVCRDRSPFPDASASASAYPGWEMVGEKEEEVRLWLHVWSTQVPWIWSQVPWIWSGGHASSSVQVREPTWWIDCMCARSRLWGQVIWYHLVYPNRHRVSCYGEVRGSGSDPQIKWSRIASCVCSVEQLGHYLVWPACRTGCAPAARIAYV